MVLKLPLSTNTKTHDRPSVAPWTPTVDDECLFPGVRTCNGMNDKQAVAGANCVNNIPDNSQRKKTD